MTSSDTDPPESIRQIQYDDGVAVLGLGKMGLPMARNLRGAGFRVVGFDVAEQSRERASAEGIPVVGTAQEAAAQSRLSLIVVGFDHQVLDVVSGDRGVLVGARPGSVLAVCATVETGTVLEVAERAGAAGVHVVDAPIARGEPAAEDGSLLVMCGGPAGLIDAISPALRAVGSDIRRLGDLGAGQIGKMLNNFLLWNAVMGNYEAMRLGGRLEVDLDALREVLMLSSGNNWALETWTRSRPMPWAEKDMRILLQHADDVELPMPTAGHLREAMKALKLLKNGWVEGGGAAASMDAFTRAHL